MFVEVLCIAIITVMEARRIGAGIYGPLRAVLAMGLGLMARPAEAAPFAYVANETRNTVSVIDTATNPPWWPGRGGDLPMGSPSPRMGTRYVANAASGTVSVIDTATNTVVATVPVGNLPHGVAVTPDGKHVYVANIGVPTHVSVIATATNTVVATIPVGSAPMGSPSPRMGNTSMSRIILPQHCFGDRHGHQHGGDHDPGGDLPQGSPSPRMGNTPMSRIRAPALFR